MRTAHYTAFDQRVRERVPALAQLVFDGDVPLNTDGTIKRGTYIVLHDMGFDSQDDERFAESTDDAADGTYRIVARIIADGRSRVREVADIVKTAMVKQILTITGRHCGAIVKDPGPSAIERDEDVSPPLLYLDIDFIWRSQRA